MLYHRLLTGARVSLRSAKTAFNVDAAFKALAHLVREDREQRRAAEAASAPHVRTLDWPGPALLLLFEQERCG
jgi:hypothetical protein